MIVQDYVEQAQRDLDAGIFDGDYELFESICELQAENAKLKEEKKDMATDFRIISRCGGFKIWCRSCQKRVKQALKEKP